MKLNALILPLTAILVVALTSLITYHVFSYARPLSVVAMDENPSLSLILPDQEYLISRRDFDALADELVIPSSEDTVPQVSYDPGQGVLTSVASPKDYVINIQELREALGADFPPSFTPNYSHRDRYINNIAQYNLHLNKVYRTPLNISLKDGSTLTDITLDSSFLRSILMPTTSELNIPPGINRAKLVSYLLAHLTPNQKKYFNSTFAYNNTQKAINARFMGDSTPVVLGVDDGPSSQGELADKYLEVDLSQQKMYFFINHTLFKEYKVSTGAEYPTPPGEFHILNKAPKAFSSIYNVWMPYWMGFKYASDVGAYLGLHEIAYAVDAKGTPVYNHGYYIGEMMTGGCVAMEPKDSREIYNLSDVGMLVRIVK